MTKINEEDLITIINNKTFLDYFNRLKLLAISLFEWEGLDEIGGNSDYLEKTLFSEGAASFVKDSELGYLTLRVLDNDSKNVYNEPTKVTCCGLNYNKNYDIDDIVYIKNNKLKLPTYYTIELFSNRLYECQRTIDINISSQKTPVLLEGDEKSLLTLKNIYKKYSGNMPVLFGRKNFNITDKINCLKTDAPYIADKLEIEKSRILNEALTFLGINNANIDKKERLITDEVESNDELIKCYLNCFYLPRKKACKEINNKFFNGKEVIKININKEIKSLLEKEFYDIINTDKSDEHE